MESLKAQFDANAPLIDVHAHIFCWGERPEQGFLSERVQRSWLTRLLRRVTGLRHEDGDCWSDKIRNRLVRDLNASSLDGAVVLAQDAVYRPDGSRDDGATHFYVANDYVFELAQEHEKVLPGASINPWRSDALHELARVRSAGARLVKIHTAIQGADPSDERFEPFYRLAADLGVALVFHTGYEHSCPSVSQQFADPLRLARPLDCGGVVIAAHAGTCAFFDPEDFYPNFVRMMTQYPNLYGDTSVMASLNRWRAMKRLSRAPKWLRLRMLHGSDYPLPPSRLPFLGRVGLFPPERHNSFDLNLRIKSAFDLGGGYGRRAGRLLALPCKSQALPPRPQKCN